MAAILEFRGVKFLNATPHDVTVYDADGKTALFTIPRSGFVARLAEEVEDAGNIAGIPVVRKRYTQPYAIAGLAKRSLRELVEELVAEDYVNVVIVSMPMLKAAAETLAGLDVLVVAPDTGPDSVVRDAAGNILGIRRFQTV
ncbi:MAG: hypothetical protein DRJ03_17400 [Chloroflexi bacterium]|nr:MAG: hypothetical protein DRJ03_17400 [Chloroflexota bacterium]